MSYSSGTWLGPYQILSAIGAGGMGEVYRARDPRIGRDVAIKVIHSAFSGDPALLERFEKEVRAAGSLNHPNILVIHDVGTSDGTPYLVSELLEGESLRELVTEGRFKLKRVLDYAKQLAQGLAAAHEKGIIHRDLKPENIFLTKDGRVKILDFGLAKLMRPERSDAGSDNISTTPPGTESGMVLGTVGYMCPEQVRGEKADHRSDIFSFGVILYEMLSGKRPFDGASPVEKMNAILKDEPPALSNDGREIPEALERIVLHCLEKKPESRFQTAQDLGFALESLSAGSEVRSTASSVAVSSPRRRKWLVPLVTMLLFAGILAIAFIAGRNTLQPVLPSFHQLTFGRGNVSSARFADEGRTVLYTADWGGNPSELFSVQPESPESRALGIPATAVAGSFGGEVAIWQQGVLSRVSLAGGTPRPIVEGVSATADWSPDGTRFVIHKWADGKNRNVLEFPIGHRIYEGEGALTWVRISPAGDRIAFIDLYAGKLVVVDLAGKTLNLYATSSGSEYLAGLAWTPKGDEVWFTTAEGGLEFTLFGVTMSGVVRPILRIPGNLRIRDISRDGRVLMTINTGRTAVMANQPGQTKERDLSVFGNNVFARISQDGQEALFDDRFGSKYSVFLRRMDGSPPTRLGEGVVNDLSPDGKWVLTQTDLWGAKEVRLIMLPTGVGQPIVLPPGKISVYGSYPCFIDAKRVLIPASEEGRPTRMFVQEFPNGLPYPITPEGVFLGDSPQIISPDGQWLIAYDATGTAALYPISGGKPSPIVGLAESDTPIRWTDREDWIYVQEGCCSFPLKVFRLNIRTGARELWRELALNETEGITDGPNISPAPDGKSYLYSYRRNVSTLYVVDGLK